MTGKLTGREVLIYLIAFFGLIIAVNVYFAVVAVKTFRGEDDLKPYQEGVEYNQTLARRAEQEKLGWKARFDVARVDAGKVHFTLTLNKADGTPLSVAALAGEFRHPADENRDRALKLVEVRPGDYEADVNGITAGAWDVVVHTQGKSAPFEATRRMFVP